MWQFFSVLGPTWLATFFLNLVVLFAAVIIVRRSWPQFKPSIGLVVGLSLLWTLHHATSTVLAIKQSERIVQARGKASSGNPATERTPEQLRGDFLNTVDAIAAKPENLTPENKAALFRQFAPLFPRGDEDRLDYARNIMIAYQCQRSVFEDALATIKAKKVVKSETQGQCEKAPGQFFGRETIIPADVAKANKELFEKLAKGKAEQGLPTEDSLRAAYDQQGRRIETLQKLFQ